MLCHDAPLNSCWMVTARILSPNLFSLRREWNCYLLPHTTHECQPLDVGLFGPLKRHWQQECHKFYQKHPILVISKLNFYLVFQQAWLNAVSPANICGGFKKAGVFPYNRNAVLTLEVAATIPVKNVKRMVL